MGLWTRKNIRELAAHVQTDESQFKRVLGPWDLILLGIGAVIGAGLFSITGIAAAQNAGPAISISFLIAALGCTFAGLCYCELASMIPVSGSAYTYAYATMGELVAWIIGWDLVLEYAIGSATVAISWSAYVVSLLQDFNIHLPPQLIASPWQPVQLPNGVLTYGWINLPAVFIVVLISILLIRGITGSTLVNGIIVALKVFVVVLFITLGFFYIKSENYQPYIPPNTGEYGSFGWSGVLRAAGVLFFAYIGFDSVSTVAQETKEPQRNLPIGIIGSLVISTILYVLFAVVLTGIVNYKDLNVAAPVALAINQMPFWWISMLVKVAILAGFTSVILVMLLGQSRIFYSMSRDGLLPRWFSSIHPRYRTPWHSNLVLMWFVGLFGAFAPIGLVGHLTSIGTLLAFVIVCMGVLVLRYTDPQYPRPFKVPFFPLFPVVEIVICVAMMASLGLDSWLRLILWLALGLVIYIWRSTRTPFKGH